MDRSSLLFCTLSLVVSLLVAALFFPFASLSTDELQAANAVTPPEEMGDIALGDFGDVSVLELVDYYIENPPAPAEEGAAPVRKVRFQGC